MNNFNNNDGKLRVFYALWCEDGCVSVRVSMSVTMGVFVWLDFCCYRLSKQIEPKGEHIILCACYACELASASVFCEWVWACVSKCCLRAWKTSSRNEFTRDCPKNFCFSFAFFVRDPHFWKLFSKLTSVCTHACTRTHPRSMYIYSNHSAQNIIITKSDSSLQTIWFRQIT